MGVGKTYVIEVIMLTVGLHASFQTAKPKHDLFDKFSTGFKQKILVLIDEATDAMTSYHEALNNVITAPTMTFEDKNCPSYPLDLHANIVLTTNSQHPVKIPKDDRRWVAVRCSDAHMQDMAYHGRACKYFGKIEKPRTKLQLRVLRGLYQGFMSRRLDHIHSFALQRPKTDFYRECTMVHAPLMVKFLSFLTRDITRFAAPGTSSSSANHQQKRSWGSCELFQRCREWAEGSGHSFGYTSTSFGIELSSLAKKPDTGIVKKRLSSGCEYHIDLGVLEAFLRGSGLYDVHA
mmetsp:Transcript_35529/g.89647  ORF Transcript_35529/g.89647 Transcript_35529/m.89647 type:complete len:291 (+) Transcript_35529:1379-2251(+)